MAKFDPHRVAALFALSLTACTSQATAPSAPVTNSPFGAKVQLAVGTANIFGDDASVATSGLNVVVTSRQPYGFQTPGDTIPLVDTPSLTGPMVLPATAGAPDVYGATVETGPGPHDVHGNTMTGTPQQNPGAPSIPPSTFGVSGGASGWGIEPFNYTVAGSNGFGQPASYTPWTVPFFDPGLLPPPHQVDPNAFVPWGGPPAFDPTHDGKGTRDGKGEPPGVLGVEEALDVFEGVAVHAGTYTLGEAIVTTTNSGMLHASATLRRTALLPAIAAPASATLDGNGGATLRVTVPPGIAETYLQIIDLGFPGTSSSSGLVSCNTSSPVTPVYYTLLIRGSGTLVVSLPDNDGPGVPGSKVPSICTLAQNIAVNPASSSSSVSADFFGVQVIGFDYPVFEASYPQSLGKPVPTITGPSGQSDITISSARLCTQSGPSASCANVKPSTRGAYWR